jgi:hypothetical protein
MYKVKKVGLIVALIISLAACGGSPNDSSNNSPQGTGEVTYQLTFNAKWNDIDFPTGFPSNPHFSPIIGATHNDQDNLWHSGDTTSAGIESMAETGNVSIYNQELEQKRTEGNVENIFTGTSTDSPGRSSLQFKVNANFPIVSAVSMLASSPDWFIGIHNVNLYENNQWIERLGFDLKLYDSGTDTGTTFTSENEDGGTGIITLLSSVAEDTDILEGVHRSNGKVVGTIVLQRIFNSLARNSD